MEYERSVARYRYGNYYKDNKDNLFYRGDENMVINYFWHKDYNENHM